MSLGLSYCALRLSHCVLEFYLAATRENVPVLMHSKAGQCLGRNRSVCFDNG
jgi:hypothetical protein